MTLTKKTAKRWPSERRLKSQPGGGKKPLRYTRDAREIRQAVNNETLHQHGDACGVLSLREVELSRRIQCFPEKHTQRERTAFTASSPSLSLVLPRFPPFSSSSGPDNFPQRAPFFYRLSTFSRPAFPRVPSSIISKRSRAGPGALVCELRRACFLRERTWCSIEQKYAWNSSFPSSPSLRPRA